MATTLTYLQPATVVASPINVEQANSAPSQDLCFLLVGGELSKKMLQEEGGNKSLKTMCYSFLHDMREKGHHCYFEYPYDDFEDALIKNQQLVDKLFGAFTGVWVRKGAKLYRSPDEVHQLDDAVLGHDGQPHAFCFARSLYGVLPTNFAIVVTMEGDEEAKWWGDGPGVYFLKEEDWDWQLLGTLLPVLKDTPMPPARRARLALMEADLAQKFPV